MSLGTILVIILILLLIGALPTWPYSGGWGYYPSGGLGLVLVIIIILLLLGRIYRQGRRRLRARRRETASVWRGGDGQALDA